MRTIPPTFSGNLNPTTLFTAKNLNPLATPETVIDQNRYIDNETTNHVTVEYSNMLNLIEYSGIEKVIVGNGDSLLISCIGTSYLINGKNDLILKNVLCIPNITKNLVSVSKLLQDNNMCRKFHGCYCFIKDKATKQIMLRGTFKDELYHLETVSVKEVVEVDHSGNLRQQLMHKNNSTSAFVLSGGTNLANTNVVVSKAVWHKRLGHPS